MSSLQIQAEERLQVEVNNQEEDVLAEFLRGLAHTYQATRCELMTQETSWHAILTKAKQEQINSYKTN